MSAIAGAFAEIRMVKSRGVLQLVIEVPLEQADAALKTLGGVPQPAAERWVGIAPLKDKPAFVAPQATPEPAAEPPAKVTRLHERQPWSTLRGSQQAAMRCHEADFGHFLAQWSGETVDSADKAAAVVRNLCEVGSRADFDKDDEARARWQRLERQYAKWRQAQETEARYGASVRR